MNYMTFEAAFGWWGIVSLPDVRKLFPRFDQRRLVEWQRKGYLQRLANGWYRFTKTPVDEQLLWWAANRMYQPSYISLETALSYHGLIPEGVFSITSVSTRRTQRVDTPVGTFTYRTIKPALYFGYTVMRWQNRPILMADLEKTLLDTCYLNPHLQTPADFEAMRLNAPLLAERLDRELLADYQQVVTSRSLNERMNTLLNYVDSHA